MVDQLEVFAGRQVEDRLALYRVLAREEVTDHTIPTHRQRPMSCMQRCGEVIQFHGRLSWNLLLQNLISKGIAMVNTCKKHIEHIFSYVLFLT